ncbi:MAG TPA: lysine 5,6-aminomutase subunit alpha [Conexibacter sp.]|jgi:beta-lysine 5,6-aminomutase alpha subunit|nr:lysine 5,6-aminomutase subunit alpha [Conexibacter sp.]
MRSKLGLDAGLVRSCRAAAARVAAQVAEATAGRTTVAVERTVARMLGVDGVDPHDVPLPNALVDHVADFDGIPRGVAAWVGNAMVQTDRSAPEVAAAVGDGSLSLGELSWADREAIERAVADAHEKTLAAMRARCAERDALREQLGEQPRPHRYVLTATGNVYEDRDHALAVAQAGGDIIAVIRSTAQSLLDYVPYGPTTEGYGGTFATQANFRIMREALDEWSRANGRYVRLSSFCSGLCMPEIAAMGAAEGLDNMVNDALYGILYRDLNILRTMIDQRVSRAVNGSFGIVINTGEDNYLRTADALEAAPSVVASQFINYFLARDCGVPDEQIALGNSFEIGPSIENGLLYEWAHAQLTRELFPDCPVKYMPPTRHMDGNLFMTHACDTLFNLITVATDQEIQTIGIPTEGIFTPHIHDRVLGMEGSNYVFTAARDLGDEIEFKPGGFIQSRAAEVLRDAHAMLEEIVEIGLFAALERGMFGDVSRSRDTGRGGEGIVEVAEGYLNPLHGAVEAPAGV